MADDRLPDAGYRLEFSSHEAGLRAHLTGQGSLPEVKACWRELAAKTRERAATALLLIDELGGRPLTEHEWKELVDTLVGEGFDAMRIAHVKPNGLQKIEHCEIFAKEAGLEARVFEHEHAASLWLRYGER